MQRDTAQLIPFPLHHSVSLIREVASNLDAFQSEYRASVFVDQINARLQCRLDRFGLATDQRDRMIKSFWCAVQPHLKHFTLEESA